MALRSTRVSTTTLTTPRSRHMSFDERRFPSPLRYPGGKGKVGNFLKLLFTENKFAGYAYAEPYAGGASVALQLLYEEYASHIHINDLNRSIHAFWGAVLDHTDTLCSRIASARMSMAEWRRQRAVQLDREPDPIDLAYSTFYLNRTNRSGIIGGGVIGGQAQGGPWKLDARFNKADLTRRIAKIARYRSRISLTNLDAAVFLKHTDASRRFPRHTVLYLDPPYYVKGAGLYESFYQHEDHVCISQVVRELDVPWIVSYDRVPQIIRLYRGVKGIRYGLSYSAGDRYSGAEVMYFAPGLRIPQVSSPAGIPTAAVRQARAMAFASA